VPLLLRTGMTARLAVALQHLANTGVTHLAAVTNDARRRVHVRAQLHHVNQHSEWVAVPNQLLEGLMLAFVKKPAPHPNHTSKSAGRSGSAKTNSAATHISAATPRPTITSCSCRLRR